VNVNWIIPGERRTALHAAVIFHHAGCVKVLLNYGADPGVRDKHGKSSIDLATETGPRPLVDDSIYRLVVTKVRHLTPAPHTAAHPVHIHKQAHRRKVPLINPCFRGTSLGQVESIASLGGAVDLIPDDWSEEGSN
jgi:hypothetical protein